MILALLVLASGQAEGCERSWEGGLEEVVAEMRDEIDGFSAIVINAHPRDKVEVCLGRVTALDAAHALSSAFLALGYCVESLAEPRGCTARRALVMGVARPADDVPATVLEISKRGRTVRVEVQPSP